MGKRWVGAWAAVGIVAAVASFVPLHAGEVGATQPAGDAAQSPGDLFAAEVAAADKAADRDSRVEHLRKAMTYRPGDPDNIVIEFRIGIELSQRDDPKRGQHPHYADAFVVFKHIVDTYKHMDYYRPEIVNHTMSPQLLVPQAAILASQLQPGPDEGHVKGKALLISAMEMLKQTYDRRVHDWTTEPLLDPRDPRPIKGVPIGPFELDNWESRQRMREQRKRDAAAGRVFGPLEMSDVSVVVTQYGERHGEPKSAEYRAAMAEVVKMFPDTPMAEFARNALGVPKTPATPGTSH